MPPLSGSPALAASGDGRLELFVFDIGGGLWHRWQAPGATGWSPWTQHGGPWDQPAGPAAVWPSGDGRLELFVTGGDGALWHRWQTRPGKGWSKWASAGHP